MGELVLCVKCGWVPIESVSDSGKCGCNWHPQATVRRKVSCRFCLQVDVVVWGRSKLYRYCSHICRGRSQEGSTKSAQAVERSRISRTGLKRSDEFRETMSRVHLGRVWSDEDRKRLSESAKKSWVGRVPSRNSFSYANRGFRSDIGHFVRSNWEANYARILIHDGVDYVYEPKDIRCDFLVPEWNLAIEIKPDHRWDELDRFYESVRDTTFDSDVIGNSEYFDLRDMYEHQFYWEYSKSELPGLKNRLGMSILEFEEYWTDREKSRIDMEQNLGG